MYRLDKASKKLTKLKAIRLTEEGLRERFDLQEWIVSEPTVLGNDIMVVGKEYILPSGVRLDILGVDRQGNLVIVELKRDKASGGVEWQAIKYASYCSKLTQEDVYELLSNYEGIEAESAREKLDGFLECDPETFNEDQRIILVAGAFDSDVVSSVLWLRDHDADVRCVRVNCFLEAGGDIFIYPEVLIPLPEAEDYVQGKETKRKVNKISAHSIFSLEKSDLDQDGLKLSLKATVSRPSDLTPRFVAFLRILMSEERSFKREELKAKLHEFGHGVDLGQAGRFLSNLSQFITKKSNPHLRQIITFTGGASQGQLKDDYCILADYRPLVEDVLDELGKES